MKMSLKKLIRKTSCHLLSRHVGQETSSILQNRQNQIRAISNQQDSTNDKKNDSRQYIFYGLSGALLVGTGLAYAYKQKESIKTSIFNQKIHSILPIIHAAEPTDGRESRREHFNFVADVVRMSAPAVVSIEQSVSARIPFGGGTQKIAVSNGSGFLVNPKGLIITNAHVVGNQSSVDVRLADGRQFEGRVVAVDESLDIAAIQINCHDLPYLKLGVSSEVMPGEWVIAMGSPLSLENTVTAGIVSNMNRVGHELGLNREKRNMHYIQTDATINTGNSGGPLINLDGDVIGVNTMMVSVGIAFAIPSDYVSEFLRRLRERMNQPVNQQTALPRRRYIGVTMLSLTPDVSRRLREMNPSFPGVTHGVYIHKVAPNSPAQLAGLCEGDVIIQANRLDVTGTSDVYKSLAEYPEVVFKIVRGKQKIDIHIKPEEVL